MTVRRRLRAYPGAQRLEKWLGESAAAPPTRRRRPGTSACLVSSVETGTLPQSIPDLSWAPVALVLLPIRSEEGCLCRLRQRERTQHGVTSSVGQRHGDVDIRELPSGFNWTTKLGL